MLTLFVGLLAKPSQLRWSHQGVQCMSGDRRRLVLTMGMP
jgi:hypothetical protein